MDRIDLRISRKDAFLGDFKSTYLIMAVVSLILLFYKHYSINTVVNGALIFTGVVLFMSLVFEPKITRMTLWEDGFCFNTDFSLGNEVSENWDNLIYIRETKGSKYRFYEFSERGKKRKHSVPKVIFSYPDVKEFINKYVPKDHALFTLAQRNL